MLAGVILFYSQILYAQSGLQLGDNFVPKEQIWVYLCLGNSAMSGRDEARDTVAHPHAWNYRIPNYDRAEKPADQWQWIPARSPLHFDVRSSGKGGPCMPFVKKMAERFPDHYFAIMQHSGSANLMDWYRYGEVRYNHVMDSVTNYLDKVTFGGFISMFGLVEVQYGGKQKDDWLDIIETTVTDVRTDLEMPDLPYVHSGYPMEATGDYDPTQTKVQGILEAEPEISSVVSNSVVISTEGLSIYQDSFLSHYDSTGCAGWAQRVVDSLVVHGWVPNETGNLKDQRQSGVRDIRGRYNRRFFYDGHTIPGINELAQHGFALFSPNGRKVAEYSVDAMGSVSGTLSGLRPGIYIIRSF